MATYGSTYDGYGSYLDTALKARRAQQGITQEKQPGQDYGYLLNGNPITYNPYPTYNQGSASTGIGSVSGSLADKSNYYNNIMQGFQNRSQAGIQTGNYDPSAVNTGMQSLGLEQSGQLTPGYRMSVSPADQLTQSSEEKQMYAALADLQAGRISNDMFANELATYGVQIPGLNGHSLSQTGGQYSPMSSMPASSSSAGLLPSAGSNISDMPAALQTEILRQRAEAQLANQGYAASRQAGRGQIESGLQQSAQSALTSSLPGIEDRLQQLGIAQSGAYPEALAKRQQEIYNQNILPTLSQYDVSTQDNTAQLPLLELQNEQALRTGGIQRGFALSDNQAQMNFANDLANRQAQTQQTASLLGVAPSLIGLMGQMGTFGGGVGMPGGLFGGVGGVAGTGGVNGVGGFGAGVGPSGNLVQGYYTSGGQFVPGSSGPATMANVPWIDKMNAGQGGFGGVAGGAIGGGAGSYIGGKYLGDLFGGSNTARHVGAGIGGAGLAYLMGGGIAGGLGAGFGGGLFGAGGGAAGGAAGGLFNWLG